MTIDTLTRRFSFDQLTSRSQVYKIICLMILKYLKLLLVKTTIINAIVSCYVGTIQAVARSCRLQQLIFIIIIIQYVHRTHTLLLRSTTTTYLPLQDTTPTPRHLFEMLYGQHRYYQITIFPPYVSVAFSNRGRRIVRFPLVIPSPLRTKAFSRFIIVSQSYLLFL